MQENHPNSAARPVTQPGMWSPAELDRLSSLAKQRKTRKPDLLRAFPGRTIGAIKVKLCAERRRQGLTYGKPENLKVGELSTTILDPTDEGIYCPTWQDTQRPIAERANERYLAALSRLAA